MEKEEWRVIKGFEDYVVSNLGRVKSFKCNKERILKPGIDGRGYYIVGLRKHNKGKTRTVHQLVAIAFLNHKPCELKIVVDHINNNKLNNRLDNLQLITHRENISKDRKGGSSKYIGVSWSKPSNKWASYINNNKKRIHLGFFNDEEEASEYYQKALYNFNNGLEITKKEPIFSSIFKGVCWFKRNNKWNASITVNKKLINLGYFTDEEEASEAYQEALTRINNGLSAKVNK